MKKLPSHILFVSHDANRAGAQLFLLNVMKYLNTKEVRMSLLLLDGGILENEFQHYCTIFKLPPAQPNSLKAKLFRTNENPIFEVFSAIKKLPPVDFVYVNTIACASVVKYLKRNFDCPLISHLHELAYSIHLYASKEHQLELFTYSDSFIACSDAVGRNIVYQHHVAAERVHTIHSFVDNQGVMKRLKATSISEIKAKYDFPATGFLIGSCGNAEWRKGIDIFVQTAYQLKKQKPAANFCFIWVGLKKEGELYEQLRFDIERMELENHIRLIEPTPEAIEIINTFDVFYLSSREDPFPLVMLEAALAQKPIVCFEKTGGGSEFVEHDAGKIVDYLDIQAIVENLSRWIDQPKPLEEWGSTAQNKVLRLYSYENSMKKIEDVISQLKTKT